MTSTLTHSLAFTVNPAPFRAAVSAAARRVQSRPTLPSLGCVLLHLDGDSLSLSAYDEEAAVTSTLAVDGRGAGTTLVSGRLLNTLVETLPNKPVEVSLDGDRLNLRCGTVQLGFPTLAVEDYPALPGLPPQIGTVSAEAFVRAVRRVAVATEPDTNPAILTALWMRFAEATSLGATDRYRAAVNELAWTSGAEARDVLVSAKTLADLMPMLADATEVGIHADGHLFGLSIRHVTIVARQLADPTGSKEIKHPGAHMFTVFPNPGDSPARLDAAELMTSLVRAGKVHEPKTPISLAFRTDEVTVGATGADSTGAVATMSCGYEGPPIDVRVNPGYLIDAVKACGTAEVLLAFPHGVRKPFLVLPDANDPYRHLIMPIQPAKD